jgi:hypothetical protein
MKALHPQRPPLPPALRARLRATRWAAIVAQALEAETRPPESGDGRLDPTTADEAKRGESPTSSAPSEPSSCPWSSSRPSYPAARFATPPTPGSDPRGKAVLDGPRRRAG